MQSIPLKGELANFSGQCFLQDSDGFMWFGSTEGLYRYDGNSFKIFRHDPDNDLSISNNAIFDLYEDRSNGIIWIATQDGLNQFDRFTETFHYFRHNTKDSTTIIANSVRKIIEDADKHLWFATIYGISMFDRNTRSFKNYQIRTKGSTGIGDPLEIYDLQILQNNELLILTPYDNYIFNVHSKTFEKTSRTGNDSLLVSMLIEKYVRHSNSRKREEIFSLARDAKENIWIKTNRGIYCMDNNLDITYFLSFSNMIIDGSDFKKTILPDGLNSELYIDNANNVWFYFRNSIYYLIHHENLFKAYHTGDHPSQRYVLNIYPEKENVLWLATLQGLLRFNRSNGDIKVYLGDTLNNISFPNKIHTIYPDRRGTMWIGTKSNGLLSIETSLQKGIELKPHLQESIERIGLEQSGLADIKYIFEDYRGHLWLGSRGYRFLHYYDRKQNKIFRLVNNPDAKYQLPERGVIRHQSGSNTLWSISSSGLYKIVLPLIQSSEGTVMATDVVKCQLINEDGQASSLPFIQQSYMDSTGVFWLCTSKAGLIKVFRNNLHLSDNTFNIKNYSISEGLPAKRLESILSDNKGNLWIGSYNGLTEFNIQSETFTNYFERHGLPNKQFIPGSAAKGHDGELFFGTIAGMISFYPDSISDIQNQCMTPVMITELKINNQLLKPVTHHMLDTSIIYVSQIELEHNQNNISIAYALLNYVKPENNQFRYILEGINDEWIYAGNRTYVDYTNLDPGSYVFRVTGSNNDGVWNEEGRSLRIIIHRPPWLSWYAYLLYAVLLTVAGIWFWRFQKNRLMLRRAVELERLEKEKVSEIDQMKSRFFANVSHEFRTPLTLIRGPLNDLMKQENNTVSIKRDLLSIMHRNTVRLQTLINQLLDISRMETGKMSLHVSKGNIKKAIRTIAESFLSLADSRNIKYQYHLPAKNHTVYYDSDKLEKILINLVSNAFKFTPDGGKISITCRFDDSQNEGFPETLYIEVSDSGIGIPESKISQIFNRFYQVEDSSSRAEGSGIGLALCKELVKVYRGEIRVRSEDGKGTTFYLSLPVAKHKFRNDEFIATPDTTVQTKKESPLIVTINDTDTEKMHLNTRSPSQLKNLVLVVEDNPDLTVYIRDKLTKDYRVISAPNGKTGFEKAISQIPDLIISDLMMPVMDGIEMCRMIRENEKTSHIPLIMLTAKADRKSKLEGLETGIDDYILKPFDAEELQVRVKNLIAQRNKLREKFRKEFLVPEKKENNTNLKDPLLDSFYTLIQNNFTDHHFDVRQMTKDLNMSRAQLFRKINALTGETPHQLLQIFRLKKAAAMLKSGKENITSIMYEVGFDNASYFAKTFRKYYGQNPSDYRASFLKK